MFQISSILDQPQIQRINQFLQLTNQPLLNIDTQNNQTIDFEQVKQKRGRQENDTVTESDITTISLKNKLVDQPTTIQCIMRPYQLEALQWLLDLHCYSNQYMTQMCKINKINYQLSNQKFQYQANAILAYEMGLGKTLIAISLISQLLLSYPYKYPFLIVVPKSTLHQWESEFKKFNDKILIYTVIGDQQTRKEQLDYVYANKNQYQVILTTYDVLHIEIQRFKGLTYEYVILDEGHRLKNAETQISNDIMLLHTFHKLIMTGTPIQNDLNELHSLLYALMPYLFSSAEQFVSIVQKQNIQEQNQQQNVELLQQILQHFLLRRTKVDVEQLPKKTEFLIICPLTTLQKKLYKGILLKDSSVMYDAVNKKNQNSEILKTSLNNIMMQLRKCADHPYLFKGVEPIPQVDGDHLFNVSGKMVVMMKLLDYITIKKKEKVLVFCQMTQLLNIISDILTYKQLPYLRLDGGTSLEDRQKCLQLFNSDSQYSPKIFLLSTRAGALGLNLTAANHLILVQSDPNPQVDLQAVGRINRIGQKKPIFVYRLMSENTVDQRLYERAQVKLQLETIIMKNADFSGCKIQKKTNKQELMDLIATGGKELFEEGQQVDTKEYDYNQPEIQFTDEALMKMLKEGEERNQKIIQEVKDKENSMFNVLKNLKQDGKLTDIVDIQNLYEFQGQNFKELTQKIMQERKLQQEAKYASKYIYLEEEDKKETNYLTVAKFKRTDYYKPEFYLLDSHFYMLQDKIFNEITTFIKPYFEKQENQQLTYDEFVEKMQNSDRKDIYINGQCPGLNQQDLKYFLQYQDIYCWPLNNQPVTRVAFNSMIDILFLDKLDEQLKLHYGIQRVVPNNKLEILQKIGQQQANQFTNDEEKQVEYSFGLLIPNKSWYICPIQQIKVDSFEDIDFEFHYQRFKETEYPDFNATPQQFGDFCRQYFEAYPDSENTQKVKRGMDRLESNALKYKVLAQCIQKNIEDGCQPNQLLYQLNYGKIYNLLGNGFTDLADRFLLLFTNIFGGSYYDVAQQVIKTLPCFALDFNLKRKTPDELQDRVNRILKAMVKKYKSINYNVKQNDK